VYGREKKLKKFEKTIDRLQKPCYNIDIEKRKGDRAMTRTSHTKSVRTSFHGNCKDIGHGTQWTERVRTSAEGNRAFRRANKRICREGMAL
jgi:hypothetical protein